MSERVLTDRGTIIGVDPYQVYGQGLPDRWEWLDKLTPQQAAEQLPAIIRELDRRLRWLENGGG